MWNNLNLLVPVWVNLSLLFMLLLLILSKSACHLNIWFWLQGSYQKAKIWRHTIGTVGLLTIAVAPVVIELSPVNLVETSIFIAGQTSGIFDLHSVFVLLKQFGGLSSAVTFLKFQNILALGFWDYTAQRISQGTFALPEFLWTQQLLFNPPTTPMPVYNTHYIYSAVHSVWLESRGVPNSLLNIYISLGDFIGGAHGMTFAEFEILTVDHFINLVTYINETQGSGEAMKIISEGLQLFKELEFSDLQYTRVLNTIPKN